MGECDQERDVIGYNIWFVTKFLDGWIGDNLYNQSKCYDATENTRRKRGTKI